MNQDSLHDSGLTLRARFRTATRDAILDAAAQLLNTEGASHTRMEDIASRAGVAVGTVYNYFENRAALVSALLESRTQALLNVLDSGPARVRTDGRGDAPHGSWFFNELEHFVVTLGAHFDRNRFLLGVLLEEEADGNDARSATRRRTVTRELLVRAERLMAKGIRARVLRRGDPAVYAALLVGMVRGVALGALAQGREFSAAGAALVVRTFLEGTGR